MAASLHELDWVALLLILFGTVWLYLPAIHTDFFADDYLFLDQVRSRSLIEALRVPDPLSNFFRPISRQLYFWVVAGLTHESPEAFRIGNLATLLVAIALLFAIARRLAGGRAAALAAGLFALHYAVDVPVRWACGSQELLAIVGALAAIFLHLSGRPIWAGVAMVFGALSKEVVLLTPAIAIVAARLPREPWRRAVLRAWPLAAGVAVWALVFILMPHRRVAQGTEVEFDIIQSPLSALVHLFQVASGLEWGKRSLDLLKWLPPLVPTAAALGALGIGWWAAGTPAPGVGKDASRARREAGERTPDPQNAVIVGIVWTVLATVPVAAVAILWSAYYYAFAMCGVALAFGAWFCRRPFLTAAIALVLVSWGSANARWLQEFGVGRNAWTPVSHINDFYIQRSNAVTDRYLESMRRRYPALPHGSTVFFAGLAGNVAFQRGDGPLLRWAYRDSSLRSYYLNAFSADKVRPGPLLVFVAEDDTLRELEQSPELFLRLAFGMLVSDRPEGAVDALRIAAERLPGDRRTDYWLAWAAMANGDTPASHAALERAGATLDAGPTTVSQAALLQLAAADTLTAIAIMRAAARDHALDPMAHALLADLLLIRNRRDPEAVVEALAARTLSPRDPYVWRRWGMIQTDRERFLEALTSFRTYERLGGSEAAGDQEEKRWVATIRAAIPKGAVEPDVLNELVGR